MRRAVLLSTLLFVLLELGARTPDKTGVPDSVMTPVEQLMRFAGNIHQFNKIFPQEKVYLEFDNTAYFQGEAIWFKAFVTEASTLKRAPSKVLYVDLVAPGGEVLQQQKLKVVGGQADGGFALLDAATGQAREKRGMTNYPSGFYEVRAYTQNMLDFSPEASFSRVFPVYLQPKRAGDYDKSVVREEGHPELEPPREFEDENRKINVDFYPEGGDMVVGLPSNIAFHCYGPTGEALDGKISVDGLLYSTVHNGMGSFVMIPDGVRESVKFITEDGKTRNFRLPKSLKSGYTMIMTENSDSIFRAQVFRTSDRNEREVGVTVTCRGELIGFDILGGADTTDFVMKSSTWPVGVCRVTLFNQDGMILASRSFFHSNSRFSAPVIDVDTDSMSRVGFGKQVMRFSLHDHLGNPIRDRFCLSVSDIADYGNGSTDNIMSNLLLSSDLKGYIRNPDYYLESNDSVHARDLDLLTLVHGWERYEWRTMSGIEEFNEKHRVEDSLTMNGWVLTYAKRDPVSGAEVLASVVPKDKTKFESFQYVTGSDGYFGFNLSDFQNSAKMRISMMTVRPSGTLKAETRHRIKIERSDFPEAREILMSERNLQEHDWKRVDVNGTEKTNDGLPEVIREDLGVLLDDVDITAARQFIDYDTFVALDVRKDAEMELDAGEYTSDVFDYLQSKGYHFNHEIFFYVHDSKQAVYHKPFDNPMTIDLIDIKSILVYDDPMWKRHIYDLVPLLIELKRKQSDWDFIDGMFFDVENGNYDFTKQPSKKYRLIDIQVKDEHELMSVKDIRNLSKRETTVVGFSEPVQFFSPQYPNGPVHGDVDYRRTLYWNPNVVTDENGQAMVEFYNNGYSTRFRVKGAGLTASGTPYILDMEW